MAAWPPLQEVRAGEFWRQVIRKELTPWQADACHHSPKNQGEANAPPPKPTLYDDVYGAYSSKSTPPAHARTDQTASSWSSTAHTSARSLKGHEPSDESSGVGELRADGGRRPPLAETSWEDSLRPNWVEFLKENPAERQPVRGNPRPAKQKPRSYGLNHHKTFGRGLSYDGVVTSHAHSSLDLSDCHYHHNTVRPPIAGRPASGTTIAYTRPWEPRHVDMTAAQSLPDLLERKTDKPEYLAARAALRGAAGYPNPKGAHPKKRPDPDGAAGLAASFGELPRAAAESRRKARPVVLHLSLGEGGAVSATLEAHALPGLPAAALGLNEEERRMVRRANALARVICGEPLSIGESVGLTVQLMRRRELKANPNQKLTRLPRLDPTGLVLKPDVPPPAWATRSRGSASGGLRVRGGRDRAAEAEERAARERQRGLQAAVRKRLERVALEAAGKAGVALRPNSKARLKLTSLQRQGFGLSWSSRPRLDDFPRWNDSMEVERPVLERKGFNLPEFGFSGYAGDR